ncbi:MAG: NUDIX hydrolase [Pyrobaculum sp.]
MEAVYRTERFTIVKKPKPVGGVVVLREYISLPPAAAVLALRGDSVVFVRQLRGALGRWTLEIPAGAVEPGESPEEAAARELAEETGYRPLRLQFLLDFYPSPGVSDELIKIYFTDSVKREAAPVRDLGEVGMEVVEMSIKEAFELIDRGVITDGKTVAALLYAERRGLLPRLV